MYFESIEFSKKKLAIRTVTFLRTERLKDPGVLLYCYGMTMMTIVVTVLSSI